MQKSEVRALFFLSLSLFMIGQSTKLTELPLSVTVCLWLTAAACFSLAKDDLYSFII